MWLPVSTVAALCLLFDGVKARGMDKEMDLIFRDRSNTEWKEAWHKERYTRCRETLIRHLYWACEKDIYRITRRSEHPMQLANEDLESLSFPWISDEEAHFMVRTKRAANRNGGSSITAECCSRKGCTWEEYAEYCPTNKRYTNYL
ncbi:PREDICTED: probable insulin-like peptide 7 [Nicrophorus vespilloides]|uniref:Probable insulin-like peptide 7 n=1 Tax=Nicrophorus vespilloides TaxID=110193 RepID=A0ABM1MFV9_NICVS|nr:PREDICTED: probable insulin-like peptide 7 [Nicrophorus vespilloides]